MAQQKRKQRRRLVLAIVLAALAGMPALGAVYQAAGNVSDRAVLDAPGELIEVDGARLHLHCEGEGMPTVVLDSGAGGFGAAWHWVQAELASESRVCTYDRPGLGFSEDPGGPYDGASIARRLHALLAASGERGPYVLVGHSFGGFTVRMYAELFPDEVAGVALIDASHPEQLARYPEEMAKMQRRFTAALRVTPALARIGVMRALDPFGPLVHGLPERQRRQTRAFFSSPRHLRAQAKEMAAFDETALQVARAHDLGDRPLAVVTARSASQVSPELFELVMELHAELASLSKNSIHRVVDEADHTSLVTDREHAHATAREIAWVVDQVRGATRHAAVR
jgi:pimeloyl-ACP methyl ester carboxylesterase